MRILLTGVSGQLGRELLPLLSEIGELLASVRSLRTEEPATTCELDLADTPAITRLLDDYRPQLIVNPAAYTAVDLAEQESDLAYAVNASAPATMAQWACRNDCKLLHFSTDYVFNGEASRAWRETDATGPQNVYGASKLAGEQAITASGCQHLILRSAWVYAAHGNNFFLKMLQLARQNRPLKIVGDQYGSPTWARNLAQYSIEAINGDYLRTVEQGSTIYHCADRGSVNWYQFANMIFDAAMERGLLDRKPPVIEVNSSEFKQQAKRPGWSVLDTTAMETDLGISPVGLEYSIKACIQEIATNEQHTE